MNKEQLLAWAVHEVKVWPTWAAGLQRHTAPAGAVWMKGESEMILVGTTREAILCEREWGAARVACGMPQSAPVQQSEPTTDENLTWVARNVHKWDMCGHTVVSRHGENIVWMLPDADAPEGAYTKQQWLARRAELQNKPSWKDAPEWAEWLAQDEDGVWYWHGEKPGRNGEDVNGIKYWMSRGLSDIADGGGQMLGDWRDTLEQRPFEPFVSVEDAPTPVTAHSILEAAGGHMRDRATTYDKPEGERSMGATVDAFRAITGHKLTEEQGWLFMQLLKAVRSQQGAYRADSYEDGAAYVSLAGEAAARERGGEQ